MLDRLKTLETLSNEIVKTVYSDTVWVIVDKNKKIIAKGVTSRSLVFIDDKKDRKKLLMYRTKKSTKRACNGWFNLEKGVKNHFEKNYGVEKSDYDCRNFLEVAEAKLIIKI